MKQLDLLQIKKKKKQPKSRGGAIIPADILELLTKGYLLPDSNDPHSLLVLISSFNARSR